MKAAARAASAFHASVRGSPSAAPSWAASVSAAGLVGQAAKARIADWDFRADIAGLKAALAAVVRP